MYIFVLSLRNLIKLQGAVWHGYIHPWWDCQAVNMAGQHMASPGGVWFLGIAT